jgi:hypothetical protein
MLLVQLTELRRCYNSAAAEGARAAGKRKEEKKKWVGWGIWPKRVLGFKNPLYFLVFESNFEFKSNSIESYMNSNTKHLTIQNKMQAA